jgi:hypothetical protein
MSLINPEWWGGFISGVVATILGFVLTMAWDYIKYRRETGERETAVLRAMREDIADNTSIAQQNIAMLIQEIQVLKEQKSVVAPLQPLQQGMWDLVKLNIPQKLSRSPDLLSHVRQTANLGSYAIETIRSRENYRITNGAMSNYHDRMRLYDETLLDLHQRLVTSLQTLKDKI